MAVYCTKDVARPRRALRPPAMMLEVSTSSPDRSSMTSEFTESSSSESLDFFFFFFFTGLLPPATLDFFAGGASSSSLSSCRQKERKECNRSKQFREGGNVEARFQCERHARDKKASSTISHSPGALAALKVRALAGRDPSGPGQQHTGRTHLAVFRLLLGLDILLLLGIVLDQDVLSLICGTRQRRRRATRGGVNLSNLEREKKRRHFGAKTRRIDGGASATTTSNPSPCRITSHEPFNTSRTSETGSEESAPPGPPNTNAAEMQSMPPPSPLLPLHQPPPGGGR